MNNIGTHIQRLFTGLFLCGIAGIVIMVVAMVGYIVVKDPVSVALTLGLALGISMIAYGVGWVVTNE